MNHAEDYCSEEGSQDAQYFASYEDLSVHKVMLADRPRMEFYRRLLSDPAIVGDKVVVDVGSGTGILSAWAAKAGAHHVFSIEASELASVQPMFFESNGLGADKVTVLHSTVEAIVEAGAEAFLEKHAAALGGHGVAIVVSEWMGFYLVHESMLPSVFAARDFFNGVNAALGIDGAVSMMPSAARLLAAPMRLGPLYESSIRPFWAAVDGMNMETYGRVQWEVMTAGGTSPMVEVIPPECLLVEQGAAAILWASDLNTAVKADLDEITASAAFAVVVPGQASRESAAEVAVDGFTLWFDVSYGDVVLDTAPAAPPTHWKQTTTLLPQAVRDAKMVSLAALAGSPLEVTFTLRRSDPESRYYLLEFELD